MYTERKTGDEMILRIKKKNIKYWGIIFFLFFFLTVDFRTNLFHNVIIAYVFAAVALFLLFYGSGVGLSKRISPVITLWIGSVAFVLTSGNPSLIIKYILGLFLLYCFAMTNGSEGGTVKVMSIYGLVFALSSFFFYIFPDTYIQGIVPHLEDYLQSDAIIMLRSNRYPGLTGHYSTNGIYLSFGIGAALAAYLAYSKGFWRKASLVCIVFCIGALLLIGKRAHLVFSLGACFLIYWVSNNQNHSKRIVKIFGGIIIGGGALVIAINQMPALSNTFDRFVETFSSGDFLMSRGLFYVEAVEQFKANPIFGIGWRAMMSEVIGLDVHNIYLQLLAENGILGFMFYIGMLIYGMVISIKEFSWSSKNRDKVSTDSYAILAFATFYMFFFSVYGMTGNPLYDEQTYYVLMISFGAIIYAHNNNSMIRKFELKSRGEF